MIEAKSSGKKSRVREEKSEPTEAKDLMKQLQTSLDQKKNGNKKSKKKSKSKAMEDSFKKVLGNGIDISRPLKDLEENED